MTALTIGEILEGAALGGADFEALRDVAVSGLTVDSRQASPGCLFFAVSGEKFDGRQFIADAAARGAAAVVVQSPLPENEVGVPLILVDDVRAAVSRAADRFYRSPSHQLCTIGVTGTNGKSSVAWILAHALARLEPPAALLGTLGSGLVGSGLVGLGGAALAKAINTTSCPTEIHRELAQAREAGAKAAVLEATSQGIAQKRTKDVAWDAAIFTNLTRDHLDIHHTMEAYAALKKELFNSELSNSPKAAKTAVINIDDPVGAELVDDIRSARSNFSLCRFSTNPSENSGAECRLEQVELAMHGTKLRLSVHGARVEFESRLIGRYNASNLLAAAAALSALGWDPARIGDCLAAVPPVPGRLERVADCDVCVVVDYAHTPDALDSAQQSLRELCSARLITVFGCGGDRDRGKRPMMARSVARYSDAAVVTSDNPRSEDPERIIDEIAAGFADLPEGAQGFTWQRQSCRKTAIAQAISLAGPGDIVLVAGKGHEDYQEIRGERLPFLDRDVCLGAMRSLGLVYPPGS